MKKSRIGAAGLIGLLMAAVLASAGCNNSSCRGDGKCQVATGSYCGADSCAVTIEWKKGMLDPDESVKCDC